MTVVRCLATLVLIWGNSGMGASIDLNLQSPGAAAGSTGVWNAATGTLHVPLVVNRSGGANSAQENEAVVIGNGTDGVFDASTAASFDINGGSTPGTTTLLTSRVYEFSSFTLTAGSTLRGQGTDPLQIRIQGDARIDGLVDLRGASGGPSIAVAANSNNGGAAGPGGGAGGAGASSAQTFPTDGTSPVAGGHGRAGTISSAGGTDGGAGGGGANLFAGAAGTLNAFASGIGGSAYGDSTLVTLAGGAGGGGAAGNSALTTGGAGGGGGGGAISLQVGGDFIISSTGQILTTGGTGGVLANAGHRSGGGGGGGGGAVLIYAGGTGTNNGSIDSTGGFGGTAFVTGGDGGNGVNRFAFSSGSFTGSGTENPAPAIIPKPTTAYTLQTVDVTSGVYDTGSLNPAYGAIVRTELKNAGDSIVYEIAGSRDAFVADNTGFVGESSLSALDGKRYFKLRVRMKAGSSSATPKVTQLAVRFQNLFQFSLVGCASTRGRGNDQLGASGWLVLLSFLCLIGAWLVRLVRTPRIQK
jgi:hypothetical protein